MSGDRAALVQFGDRGSMCPGRVTPGHDEADNEVQNLNEFFCLKKKMIVFVVGVPESYFMSGRSRVRNEATRIMSRL